MSYQAVIFDFDYTLADCTSGIVDCVNTAFNNMGIEEASVESIRKAVGMTLPNTYLFLTKDENKDKAKNFQEEFMIRADEVMAKSATFLPFAKEVVLKLKEDGIQLGIVTTKYRHRIISIFELMELPGFIQHIIGADNVKKEKPDPEGLIQMIHDMKLKKEEVLYIGDSLVDADTAKNAGVDFAAVTTGATLAEEFQSYQPILIMEDLRPVISLVKM
jgi:phosphoglycolate phosphatase